MPLRLHNLGFGVFSMKIIFFLQLQSHVFHPPHQNPWIYPCMKAPPRIIQQVWGVLFTFFSSPHLKQHRRKCDAEQLLQQVTNLPYCSLSFIYPERTVARQPEKVRCFQRHAALKMDVCFNQSRRSPWGPAEVRRWRFVLLINRAPRWEASNTPSG